MQVQNKTSQEITSEFYADVERRKNSRKEKVGYIAAGSALAAITAARPASAQQAGVDDVSALVTALGGISSAVIIVVLGAMGARMAIKIVNRVSVKG